MNLKVLALIPARGESKGIPRKNLAPVAGRPLIAWTIEAALRSRVLDRVVVSTEDAEIAEVARSCGAEVPFRRPAELAQDDTPGMAPVVHALRWLEEKEGYRPEFVMLLQPTSPLRVAKDIEAAVQLARERLADSVISVCQVQHHPHLIRMITQEGKLVDFLPSEGEYRRRQDFPPAYALNGAIYLVRREVLLEKQTFYTEATYAYVMPPERSLDVDTPWDLRLVDLVLQSQLPQAER